MCPDDRRIDQQPLRLAQALRQRREYVLPNAAPGPPNKSIIDGLGRPIFCRTVAPPAASAYDMHNAAQDTPVIDPLQTPRVGRQQRYDMDPLLIGKPE
jgi:hypothetical protein